MEQNRCRRFIRSITYNFSYKCTTLFRVILKNGLNRANVFGSITDSDSNFFKIRT